MASTSTIKRGHKARATKGKNQLVTMQAKSVVSFDRRICNDFAAASSREWLVTNAIGGYASGTIAGCATRRYHGILLAALQPPVGRTQLVAALDEIVSYAGSNY